MASNTADTCDLRCRLADIVGDNNVLTQDIDTAPYLTEWRDLYRGRTRAVVRPGNTEEVSRVLRTASALRIGVVPQGGNTGLVGGQIPSEVGDEIVLSLKRLNRIRMLDPDSDSLVVEAGVTLAEAREAARSAGRLLPLQIAAEGSCTIGGNLATNAGGVATLAYGNARDLVLGLEVVLADGRIWNGLSKLRKDNTGYDLKNLFVGSEGTLGIITAATLKLSAEPCVSATTWVAVPSATAAIALLRSLRSSFGPNLVAFELMSANAVAFVLRHGHAVRNPVLGDAPWYVLIELASAMKVDLTAILEATLSEALESEIALDAAIASSREQALQIWRLRDLMSEVQGAEGGSIKHDISIPISEIPAFLVQADAAVERLAEGARPAAFGHAGDGNIHYNVSQPLKMDKATFLQLWRPMNDAIHDIAARSGGSISAEHGIGRLKRDKLPHVKDPVALELMRLVKAMLDPSAILNPGKLL